MSDERVVIKTGKRLDTQHTPAFEAELKHVLEEEKIYNFTVDMSETAYISSVALRAFLAAQKKVMANNGEMLLTGVSPMVMEVFDVTGYSGILTIEEA